jgi:hypothetical protein
VADRPNTSQRVDLVGAEDLVDAAHTERHPNPAVLEYGDAGTLLTPVLQRHEPE